MDRNINRKKQHYNKGQKVFSDPRKEYEESLKKFFGNNYINLILSDDKEDYNSYIDKVERYVEKNLRSISTSQLRNIFSQIKGKKDAKDLWLLRPKLAYVAGREDKKQMKELVYLLDQLIKNVDDKNINKFIDFFESIIAYHKYFNPKTN